MSQVSSLKQTFIDIRSNKLFEIFVVTVIVVSALKVGLGTYPLGPRLTNAFKVLDYAVTSVSAACGIDGSPELHIITPLGAARSEALLDDPRSSQGLQSLAEGRFQTRRSNDMVSYAQTVTGEGVMESVFLSQRKVGDDGRLQMLVTVAKEGEIRIDPISVSSCSS